MSSAGTRTRNIKILGDIPSVVVQQNGTIPLIYGAVRAEGRQMTVSESHRRNRKTGNYDGGGPFYTSKVMPFIKSGYVKGAYSFSRNSEYSGPTYTRFPSPTEMTNIGYKNINQLFGAKNEAQMAVDGTNAISYCNPVNPASNLGTTLAESMREGIPSLPGIKLWKDKTRFLKGLGSEYLNYQFGWAPLLNEVHEVTNAARLHATIAKQYQHGEGRNTHRRFDYPLQRSIASSDLGAGPYPNSDMLYAGFYENAKPPKRVISLVRETKRWFEGSFTYALPSSTDSWRKMLGFGSEADQVFGLALSPDVLWELTPWSWAVDWFSNAGEVINNVTNFGLAGLVLRYGYMMEESIERVTAEQDNYQFYRRNGSLTDSGMAACGYETVTKLRVPASPFGFSIGWEGLSPTQLAITAALGITRVL